MAMGFLRASCAACTGVGRAMTVFWRVARALVASCFEIALNELTMPGSMAAHPPFSPAMATPLTKVWGTPGPKPSATMARAFQK